ncbi:HalOD1 output domain-containing protein [Haloglomus litoreum]|uniref:HalOD1 output domain-containing protein n=1 Tax=Haloglomus litoreum TaxID=3034026 RepID=UPI0023E7ADD6|nr:HalOD1 output domain-containing protein [Haloglomus sp. DT116]
MTGTERGPETDDLQIVRRTIQPSCEAAEFELVELVAELEGCEADELPSLYDRIDHIVEYVFRNPPSSEAQLVVEFSYAGYRITIDQQGNVTLLAVKESAAE